MYTNPTPCVKAVFECVFLQMHKEHIFVSALFYGTILFYGFSLFLMIYLAQFSTSILILFPQFLTTGNLQYPFNDIYVAIFLLMKHFWFVCFFVSVSHYVIEAHDTNIMG